jgi:hypothetical protein
MARALRYVAECRERGTRLKAFMKAAGGVNGCAARYGTLNGAVTDMIESRSRR